MNERKCEFVDTVGFLDMLYDFRNRDIPAQDFIDFIRTRVEEEIRKEREACARACEKLAEERFNEHGIREWDTGATYYKGRAAEEYESRDEEDESCAKAIRARGGEK